MVIRIIKQLLIYYVKKLKCIKKNFIFIIEMISQKKNIYYFQFAATICYGSIKKIYSDKILLIERAKFNYSQKFFVKNCRRNETI